MTNDWIGFKKLVRSFLSDVVPGDGLYTLAVAEFCKAKFAREVDHDLEFHNSYMQSYLVYRQRLLGYAHSNPALLSAAVQSLITIDANRQGTGPLLTGMIAQARTDIEGVGTLIDNLIRQGVIEIESFIPLYRTGQVNTYTSATLTQECQASKGALPVGAQLKDAYITDAADADTDLDPLIMTDWANREDFFSHHCGHPQSYICLDPYGVNFYIFPVLDADHNVKLVWDGLKVDFADTDTVTPPFDEAMAQVVAEYVKGHFARDVQKDYAMAQMILKPQQGTYYMKRRKLYLDAMDRQRKKNLRLETRRCREPAPVTTAPGGTPEPPPGGGINPTFDNPKWTFDNPNVTFDQTKPK